MVGVVDHHYSAFDTVQIEVKRHCYQMTVFLRVEACVDQEVLQARFKFLELWRLNWCSEQQRRKLLGIDLGVVITRREKRIQSTRN